MNAVIRIVIITDDGECAETIKARLATKMAGQLSISIITDARKVLDSQGQVSVELIGSYDLIITSNNALDDRFQPVACRVTCTAIRYHIPIVCFRSNQWSSSDLHQVVEGTRAKLRKWQTLVLTP